MAQNLTSITVYSSAARTATPTARNILNKFNKAVSLTIDVTATSATPSVVFTIQGLDQVSGEYYTLLASAAITAVGTTTIQVGPGFPATANVSANAQLPRVFRVTAVHGDADSITYSVGANLLI